MPTSTSGRPEIERRGEGRRRCVLVVALAHVVGEEQENEREQGGEDHDHVERLLELARERL